MNPKFLSFSGLNCFSTKQEIDFEKLTSNGIFAILGPTGSGKSTILDAITLALFGQTQRSRNKSDFININSKTCLVEFSFIADELYTIKRIYNMKKNGIVESSATLICKEKIIAEGTFAVNDAIKKITGLSMDDFSKCIALPQGEFAAFLKAKPAERINLVGNLFGLNQFGDSLIQKVNEKKLLLKQKTQQINLSLTELGEDLDNQLLKLKEELDNKTILIKKDRETLESLMVEENNTKKALENIKKRENLKIKLANLKDKCLYYEKQKDEYEAYKLIFNNKTEITKLYDLNQQAKKLNLDLSELNNQKAKLDKEFSLNSKIEQDIIKKEMTINNSDAVLLELQEFKGRFAQFSELKKQESNFNIKINNRLTQINEAKAAIKKNITLLTNTTNELNNLKEQKTKINEEILAINKQKNALENLTKLSTYNLVLKKLQSHYESLLNLSNEKFENINLRNKIIRKNENKLKMLIRNFGDLESFKLIVDKTKKQVLEFNIEHKNLDILYERINTFETELEKLKQNEVKIKSDIIAFNTKTNYINDNIYTLKEEYKKINQEKNNYILNNAEQLVSDESTIGQPCPICGNTITRLFKNSSHDLTNLDHSLSLIEKNIENSYIEKAKNQTDLAKSEQILESISEQRKLILDIINYFKSETNKILIKFVDLTEDAFVCFLDKKNLIEKENMNFEKIQFKIESLEKQNNQLTLLNQNDGAFRICYSEMADVIKNYISKIQNILAEAQLEHLSITSQNIDSLSKSLDTLQEQLSNIDIKVSEIQNNQLLLNQEITEFETKIKFYEEDKIEINNQLIEIKNRISLLEKEKMKFLSSNESLDDKIKNIKSFKENIIKEKANITKKLDEIKQKTIKINTTIEQKKIDYENINLGILELKKNLEPIIKLCRTNDPEILISKLNSNFLEFEKNYNDMQKEMQYIQDSLNEIPEITEYKLKEDLSSQIENLKIVIENNQIDIGKLQQNLIYKKEQKLKQKELMASLDKAQKELDLVCEISSLIHGKELLAFVAEELLQEICQITSFKLVSLYNGRYSLFYKNKDFWIIDSFDNGNIRSISTLSGGETFIISLALSLSIAESIPRMSNKHFNFFFLDEGFGTLDNELRESIVFALNKLKDMGINIGFITHMEEIVNDIKTKLIIVPSKDPKIKQDNTIILRQDI